MKTKTLFDKKSALTVIFFTVFIYLVGFGVIIPLIPILSRDFGATALQTGLLMSCYSAMQFLFAPFWGKLSDRWGRRPILIFCLLGEFFSYLLLAHAQSLEMLFVARTLAGFFGASISTASAYISDITGPEERSKGMALIGAAFGLGFVIGPTIGGIFLHLSENHLEDKNFGMMGTSYFVAALCLLNFLFALKFLKESLHEKNLEKKPHRLKLIYSYLNRKTVGPLIVSFFLSSLAMSSMEATLILFMGEKFAWSAKEVSFGFAYIGIIMIFTQGFLVRRLLPLWGERKVLRLGLLLFMLGFIEICLSNSILNMAVAMTFLSLGQGLVNPSLMGSISLLVDSKEQGVTMGVNQGLSSLGRIIGPALGGAVYGSIGIRAPFFVSAAMALIAILLVQINYSHIPVSAKLKGS